SSNLESPASPEPTAPRHAPHVARGERLALGTLVSWGPPIIGLSSALFFLQFFFLNFATDVLLIAPAIVGALFAAGRLWDAVSDPIVGTLSDRTRTRFGRRRPWMLSAIPLLLGSVWMTWVPPAGLTGTPLVIWVAVALFGFYTAFTMYQIPHLSLGAELSTDHHDRNRVFGVQSAAFSGGMIFAFGAMQVVMNSGDQRSTATGAAVLLCALIAGLLAVPPLRVREREEYQATRAAQPLHALRDVLRNPDARRLLMVQFVVMVGISVVGMLSPYLVKYVLKRPDMVGPLPTLFLVFSIGSIPIWVRISRRIGKRAAWTASLVLSGVAFGGVSFAGENDVLLLAVLLPVAGFATGCGGMVAPSMLADVIDGDELATGERKEGAYNAAYGFALKVANAFMILATSLVLQGLGFAPNVEQSDAVKWGLRLLYGALPLVMYMVAASVLRGFRLDEAEHARIRAALDARRAEQAAGRQAGSGHPTGPSPAAAGSGPRD
ncbi:MAG TPA: MFS transporter, partial [Alphaproteobacteria bacterium]|nr:MFS transporter [Alphaproteobacteria bacterium]